MSSGTLNPIHSPPGAWGPPMGSRGFPVGVVGDFVPAEAEVVCRHCLQILTAEMIKI